MADQGIEILSIQDSDLELGTQKYFQFCVCSPNWDSLMPHFNRKLSESWASLVAQTVKNPPAMRETWVWSWVEKIPWRTAWQSTPVFLPEESHGQRSLVGYSPWCCKESDTTEPQSALFIWLLLVLAVGHGIFVASWGIFHWDVQTL